MRARSLDKLRAKNYDGSTEEWLSILEYCLVSRQSDIDSAVRDNLDVSCAVSGKDPKAVMTLSFRTRVQDITQRLGSIELPQTEDTDDVDLFGWATQLASSRDQLKDEAAQQGKKAGAESQTIVALQNQLEELTKAKTDHEQELVSKFAQLLNEKKHQLRRLHRILETAQVDPQKVSEAEASIPLEAKRGRKRSARESRQGNESDESEGFDEMDMDKPAGAEQSDEDDEQRAQQTTDSEDTASEDEAHDFDQPVMSQTEAGSDGPPTTRAKEKASQSMPAPRELPFTSRGKQGHKDGKAPSPKPQAPIDDDEETASEDDEL